MSIKTLLKAWERTKRQVAALSNTFFPRVELTDKDKIRIDQYMLGRDAARATVDKVNVRSLDPITTVTHAPIEFSESVVITDKEFGVVPAGRDEYTTQELAKDIYIIQELENMHVIRRELMATEVLTVGKITDGRGTTVHNFKKNPNLNVANVNFSANNPLDKIGDVWEKMVQDFLAPVGEIILVMGTFAYDKFMGNTEVQKQIEKRVSSQTGNLLNDATKSMIQGNLQIAGTYVFEGKLATRVTILRYSDVYKDDSGTVKTIFPKGSVVVTTPAAFSENTQIYASCLVINSAGMPERVIGDMVPYSYGDKEMRTYKNVLLSRPLFIPRDVNHFGHLTVTA